MTTTFVTLFMPQDGTEQFELSHTPMEHYGHRPWVGGSPIEAATYTSLMVKPHGIHSGIRTAALLTSHPAQP